MASVKLHREKRRRKFKFFDTSVQFVLQQEEKKEV
jgi:hypothetical protein